MMIFDIFNYSLAIILIATAGAWIFLLRSMLATFRDTPHLDVFEEKQTREMPKISIILPARNEQEFISKCLDSLLKQDCKNYEIIAIDDSSQDDTGKIIKEYAQKDPRVIHVSAPQKPEGWIGKNWACMQGYKKTSGKLLLFTDSDTTHAPNTVSLAAKHLQAYELDALTAIPKLLALDFWTRITLPIISVFLHTQFSALRVNDPKKNTGYFFGSFFIIKKEVYEAVGTHEGVKHEIIEDGALGKKVKESGYKMRMVRGEHLIDAVWARDAKTLQSALRRLMVPLYLQSRGIAVGIFFAVAFLVFVPFVAFGYSLVIFDGGPASALLAISSMTASALVYIGAIIESSKGLYTRLRYAIFAPLGGFVLVEGFLTGLILAKSDTAVSWRGRKYSLKDHAQNAVNV